ncbi:MAG: bifunctional nuclease domain-containing protein [Balneolaceae bacterium]|jgi:bifunctional DNase/RNase
MKVEMDILGLSTSPGSGGAYALILTEKEGSKRLPIIIGAFEAQAIALEMEQIKPPRPMTHDLLKNIILGHESSVREVVISELHEGTFFAQIHIQSQGNSIELDARPSDAIALAIRFQAPVYVAEEVLHEAGIEADDIRQETEGKQTREPIQSEGKTHPPLNKMDQLEQELKIAIETENYEKAASIRDKINQLKG